MLAVSSLGSSCSVADRFVAPCIGPGSARCGLAPRSPLWAWRPVIGRKLFFVAHHLTKPELPRKPGVKSAADQPPMCRFVFLRNSDSFPVLASGPSTGIAAFRRTNDLGRGTEDEKFPNREYESDSDLCNRFRVRLRRRPRRAVPAPRPARWTRERRRAPSAAGLQSMDYSSSVPLPSSLVRRKKLSPSP